MRRGWAWLAVGFLGNGFAQFLQKYLHAAGLGSYVEAALVVMYISGAVFAAILLAAFGGRVRRTEVLLGLGVGLCSYFGNFAVLRALGGLPAYTVFPLVVGGPIVVVALVARLFLGEKIGWSATSGILCGLVAIVLLIWG